MGKKKNVETEEYQYIPLNDHNNFYYTFDLGCSAALVSAGFELLSLDKGDRRKVQFIFRRADGIDDVVDQYFADRLEVKARRYFDNLRALKNSIYE